MQSPDRPSQSLIKLVDLAVIPAAILIFTKIISLLVLNSYLGLNWDVKAFSDAFFGIRLTYVSDQDIVKVVSYSDLFMHIAALSGAVLALSKLYYLHPKYINPAMVLKLAKKDSLHYIQSSFHMYHEAIVWCAFLIISDLLIIINFIQNLTFDWVLGVSIISTLVVIFILVRTVDRDIYTKNIKYK